MMHIVCWIGVFVGMLLFAWGFLDIRKGVRNYMGVLPLDATVGMFKLVAGIIIIGLLLIGFVSRVMAAPRDNFIAAMESAFGMFPGGTRVVPQCQCSVEYLGTRPQGRGVYAVYVKKLD